MHKKFSEFLIEKGRGAAIGTRLGNAIIELNEKNKLAIFLLGPPGSGKSTFVKNYIFPKNPNFKSINSDEISKVYQKWCDDAPKEKLIYKYVKTFNPQDKAEKYLKQIISKGINFISDSTGNSKPIIENLYKFAKINEYKVVFIHVLTSLKEAMERVDKRNKDNVQDPVDKFYVESSHKGVVGLMKHYIKLLDWSKDSYYAVSTKNNMIEFYKLTQQNKVIVYKNNKYEDEGLSLANFYKAINEGLRKYYGYDVLLEDLGIEEIDYF